MKSWLGCMVFCTILQLAYGHLFMYPQTTDIWFPSVTYNIQLNHSTLADWSDVDTTVELYNVFHARLSSTSQCSRIHCPIMTPPVSEISTVTPVYLKASLYRAGLLVANGTSDNFLLSNLIYPVLTDPSPGLFNGSRWSVSRSSLWTMQRVQLVIPAYWNPLPFSILLVDSETEEELFLAASTTQVIPVRQTTIYTASFDVILPNTLYERCLSEFRYRLVLVFDFGPHVIEASPDTKAYSPFPFSLQCQTDLVLGSLTGTTMNGNVYPSSSLTLQWSSELGASILQLVDFSQVNMSIHILHTQTPSRGSTLLKEHIDFTQYSTTFSWPNETWCNEAHVLIVELNDFFSLERKYYTFTPFGLTTRCFAKPLVILSPCPQCSYAIGSTMRFSWVNGRENELIEWKSESTTLFQTNNTKQRQTQTDWLVPDTFSSVCPISIPLSVKGEEAIVRVTLTCRTTAQPIQQLAIQSPVEDQMFLTLGQIRLNWTSSVIQQWVGLFLLVPGFDYFVQRVYVTTTAMNSFLWRIPADFPCSTSDPVKWAVRYWSSGFSQAVSAPFYILCYRVPVIHPMSVELGETTLLSLDSSILQDESIVERLGQSQSIGSTTTTTTTTTSWSIELFQWNNQTVGRHLTRLGTFPWTLSEWDWVVPSTMRCNETMVLRLLDNQPWLNQLSWSVPFIWKCSTRVLNQLRPSVTPTMFYVHDLNAIQPLQMNITWSGFVQGRTIRVDGVFVPLTDRPRLEQANETRSFSLATGVDSTVGVWMWETTALAFLCQMKQFRLRLSYEPLGLSSPSLSYLLGPGASSTTNTGYSFTSTIPVYCRSPLHLEPNIFVTSPSNHSLLYPNTNYTLTWTGGFLNQSLAIGIWNPQLQQFVSWLSFDQVNTLQTQRLIFSLDPESAEMPCGLAYQFVYRYNSDWSDPFDMLYTSTFFEMACTSLEVIRPFSGEGVVAGSSMNVTWLYGLIDRRVSIYLVALTATATKETYLIGYGTTWSRKGRDLNTPPWSTTSVWIPLDIPCGTSTSYQVLLQSNDQWSVSGQSELFSIRCPLLRDPPVPSPSDPVSYVLSFQFKMNQALRPQETRNVLYRGNEQNRMGALYVVGGGFPETVSLLWSHSVLPSTHFSCSSPLFSVVLGHIYSFQVRVTPRSMTWNWMSTTSTTTCIVRSAEPLRWDVQSFRDHTMDKDANLANALELLSWNRTLVRCADQYEALGFHPSICESDPSLSLQLSSTTFLPESVATVRWSGASHLVDRRVWFEMQRTQPALFLNQTSPPWSSGWIQASLGVLNWTVPVVECDSSWWMRLRLEGAETAGWIYSGTFTISCVQSTQIVFAPSFHQVLKVGLQHSFSLGWREDLFLNQYPLAILVPSGSFFIGQVLSVSQWNQFASHYLLQLTGALIATRHTQTLSASIPSTASLLNQCSGRYQVAFIKQSSEEGRWISALSAPVFLSCGEFQFVEPFSDRPTLVQNGTSLTIRFKGGVAGERVDVWLKTNIQAYWIRSMTIATQTNELTEFHWRLPVDLPCSSSLLYRIVISYTSLYQYVNKEVSSVLFPIVCLSPPRRDMISSSSSARPSYVSLQWTLFFTPFEETIHLFCRGQGMSPCVSLTAPNANQSSFLYIRQKSTTQVQAGTCTSLTAMQNNTHLRVLIFPRLIEIWVNDTLDQSCGFLGHPQPFLIDKEPAMFLFDPQLTWKGRVQIAASSSSFRVQEHSCLNDQGICQTYSYLQFRAPAAQVKLYADTPATIRWTDAPVWQAITFELLPQNALTSDWSGLMWRVAVSSRTNQTDGSMTFVVPNIRQTHPILCETIQPFVLRATYSNMIQLLSPVFYISCTHVDRYIMNQPFANIVLRPDTSTLHTISWSGGLPNQRISFGLFENDENNTPDVSVKYSLSLAKVNHSMLVVGSFGASSLLNEYENQVASFRFREEYALNGCGVRYRMVLFLESSAERSAWTEPFHIECFEMTFLQPSAQTVVYNGTAMNITWRGGIQGVGVQFFLINHTNESSTRYFVRNVQTSRAPWTSFSWRIPSHLPCNRSYTLSAFVSQVPFPFLQRNASDPIFVRCLPAVVQKDIAVRSGLVLYTASFTVSVWNPLLAWRNLFCQGLDNEDRTPCVFLSPDESPYLHFRHRSEQDWNSGCNSNFRFTGSNMTDVQVRVEVKPRTIDMYIQNRLDASCAINSFLNWGTWNTSVRYDTYNNWFGHIQMQQVQLQFHNVSEKCQRDIDEEEEEEEEDCLPSLNLAFQLPTVWYYGQTEWVNWTYAVGYPLDSQAQLEIEFIPVSNPLISILRFPGGTMNASLGYAALTLALEGNACDTSYYIRGRVLQYTNWIYSTQTAVFVACERIQTLTILQPANNTVLTPSTTHLYRLQWRGDFNRSELRFLIQATKRTNVSDEYFIPLTPWMLNTLNGIKQMYDFRFTASMVLRDPCDYTYQVVAQPKGSSSDYLKGTRVHLLCNRLNLLQTQLQVNSNGVFNVSWLNGQAGRQVHILLQDRSNLTNAWTTLAFVTNSFSWMTTYLWKIAPEIPCNRFYAVSVQSTSIPFLFGRTISDSGLPFFVKCSKQMKVRFTSLSSFSLKLGIVNLPSRTLQFDVEGITLNQTVDIWWTNRTILTTTPLFQAPQDTLIEKSMYHSGVLQVRTTIPSSVNCSDHVLYTVWILQADLQQIESVSVLVPCQTPLLPGTMTFGSIQPLNRSVQDTVSLSWILHLNRTSMYTLSMVPTNPLLLPSTVVYSSTLVSGQWTVWLEPLSCPGEYAFQMKQNVPWESTDGISIQYQSVKVWSSVPLFLPCKPVRFEMKMKEVDGPTSVLTFQSSNYTLKMPGDALTFIWQGGVTNATHYRLYIRQAFRVDTITSLPLILSSLESKHRNVSWILPEQALFNWEDSQLPKEWLAPKYISFLQFSFQADQTTKPTIQQEVQGNTTTSTWTWSDPVAVNYTTYWSSLVIETSTPSTGLSNKKRDIIIGVCVGVGGSLLVFVLLLYYFYRKRKIAFYINGKNKSTAAPTTQDQRKKAVPPTPRKTLAINTEDVLFDVPPRPPSVKSPRALISQISPSQQRKIFMPVQTMSKQACETVMVHLSEENEDV